GLHGNGAGAPGWRAATAGGAAYAAHKPPPRETRFSSPLEQSRVHWVRPEVVVEVTYLTWTEGGLLRAVSYQGQREDKLARQVVRGGRSCWPPLARPGGISGSTF